MLAKKGNVINVELVKNSVNITPAHIYKHLGTRTPADGSAGPDIRAKTSQMATYIHPYKKKILSNPDIPVTTRSIYLRSLFLSKNVFGIATWSKLKVAD